jgi:hypothetical protein
MLSIAKCSAIYRSAKLPITSTGHNRLFARLSYIVLDLSNDSNDTDQVCPVERSILGFDFFERNCAFTILPIFKLVAKPKAVIFYYDKNPRNTNNFHEYCHRKRGKGGKKSGNLLSV